MEDLVPFLEASVVDNEAAAAQILATILAALRWYQQTYDVALSNVWIIDVASCGGDHPLLTVDDIDVLCDDLNSFGIRFEEEPD